MDATQKILAAVARVDLLICTIAALPWGGILTTIGVAAIMPTFLPRIRGPTRVGKTQNHKQSR